jgi:hypothetical protein
MPQTLKRHVQRLVVLPPLAVIVIVLAAVGMMIVVAPREFVSAAGLLELRRAYGHAFGLLMLLLTAWASWIVAGRLAASHARSVHLARIPTIFDKLSAGQRRLVLECLAQGLVMHRGRRDSVARSLCELRLLTPPPDEPKEPFRVDVAYVMPEDVADILRAHLLAGAVPPGQRFDDIEDAFG